MSMIMEQAIEILKSDLAIQKEFKALPDHIEALEMVIQFIEQNSCSDCISRQEVLDSFWKLNVELRPSTIDAILNMVNGILPVNPQQKTAYCKDCKYFEYDSLAKVDGVKLIVAHEICKRWGDGCKTSEYGYCFMFEPKEG